MLKSINEHIEFDIDAAKEQSSKNPIFYIQYAHARASSILNKAADTGIKVNGNEPLESLNSEQERMLIKEMIKLPELIGEISSDYQVHVLAHWLLGLAGKFHKFYDTSPALSAESPVREARLALVLAAKTVIGKALSLLGISAPEKM